ncbi:uncharacterized protein KGF55_000007 [Candida pseudojiufengensis]|uniref:uncharacterized protein n=1 Tax=Candida pseudojiufengensis TaxID=497109 RepID=UPI002224D2E7|nr:uncharacterized protein KGF55_000007 [Candida pseudojiufengensis]KAI5968160.1 hypothetical protein KGF55_000007 [Candida pseudojiufengensis]
MFLLPANESNADNIIYDIGASSSVISNKKIVQKLDKTDEKKFKFRNIELISKLSGILNININDYTIKLPNVYYIPEFGVNIVLISQLTSQKLLILITDAYLYIMDKIGNVIPVAKKENNLYVGPIKGNFHDTKHIEELYYINGEQNDEQEDTEDIYNVYSFRSDNAPELPTVFQLQKLGIEKEVIGAYSPETNGIPERFNRVIFNHIKKIILTYENHYNSILILFNHIINYVKTIINHTSRYGLSKSTPFELFYHVQNYKINYQPFGVDALVKASNNAELLVFGKQPENLYHQLIKQHLINYNSPFNQVQENDLELLNTRSTLRSSDYETEAPLESSADLTQVPPLDDRRRDG